MPLDSPMRRLPRSIVTPHLGYATAGNYREYYGKTVENIVAFLDGRPIRALNPTRQPLRPPTSDAPP